MPVPIRLIPDKPRRDTIDYSFLINVPSSPSNKKVTASNKDADVLFQIWHTSRKNSDDTYTPNSSIDSEDIKRLKSRGFLVGTSDNLEFTKRGKLIVTTMALGEPNKFGNEKQQKPYTEILASMDKRGKKGYRIPKYATNNSNNIRL